MTMEVSFIVVARDAAATIGTLLECLKRQSYPHERVEVLLVDGLSSDETKSIMQRFREEERDFKRVVVLDNPGRTLPCGWNVALDAAQGEAILRVDAHATIPESFIELNVRDIQGGEDICGGTVLSVPGENSAWGVVLNEAENSMFGGGFAAFRRAKTARYVSTAAFAMYRRAVFDRVGRYNETLTRTEDNEMHYRMRKAGYRFYYDPEIVSRRVTRSDLGKLLKQKYLNGYWIGRTLGVEPRCFSLYHFVPLAFVLAVIFCGVLAAFGIGWPSALLWGAYALADLAMTVSAIAASKDRNILFFLLPMIFLLLHLSYGAGTLVGIVRMLAIKTGIARAGD